MQPAIHRPDIEMVKYLTECTLATVDRMAMAKKRPQGEFKRQKSIAQCGVDWVKGKGATCTGRVADVVNKFSGNVDDYAQDITSFWEKR